MSHTTHLHASAFAYAGIGCLLLGASGRGKSAVIAQALLHGAALIADDQVMVHSAAAGAPLPWERSKSPGAGFSTYTEVKKGISGEGVFSHPFQPSPEIMKDDFDLSQGRGTPAALPVDNTDACDVLIASAPPEIAGVLELRGLGIIRVPCVENHPIHLAVELTDAAIDRLPPPQTREFLGIHLPFLHLPAAPHTPVASLLLYMQAMQERRIVPEEWRPSRAAFQTR